MSEGHRPCHVVTIGITLAVMCLMFFINAISTSGIIPNLFVYEDMEELSERYYITITPAGWTFSIWGAIYVWQVLFIAYGLSTICRQGTEGYLYYSPGIMPIGIYISYIFNVCFNISWLFLFDREHMEAALVVLALIVFTLFIALGLSFKAVSDNLDVLKKNNLMREAWLIRFLVQNAHAFYATWCCVATLLNLTIVLTHRVGLDVHMCGTIALGILAGEILLWVTLDFFVLHKHTNYLFSPYIVLPIALGGSMAKNFVAWHTNSIITVVLLAVAILALIVKFVLLFLRHFRNRKEEPIQSTLEKQPIPA